MPRAEKIGRLAPRRGWLARAALVSALVVTASRTGAEARWRSASPRLREASDLGRAAPDTMRQVVVGLALRDRGGLDALLARAHDPASAEFRHFLTPAEFAAAHAPTAEAEAAVVAHLEANGLEITGRVPNRLLVAAAGTTTAVERAFGVELHDVMLDGRRHFAATTEPVLPARVAGYVAGVLGLDDLAEPRAHLRARPAAAPHAALGATCCHLGPADVASLYDLPAGGADGTGETLVIAGVYAWNDRDVAAFDTEWALPALPAGSEQVCTGGAGAPGCRFAGRQSMEVALDVELAHAVAPGARIVNYMAASPSLPDLAMAYDRIVADDPGHVVMTSWGVCEANVPPAAQEIEDQIFAAGSAVGQAWFAATGDSGSHDCRGERHARHRQLVTVDQPANSPHVVAVGGTTPRCSAGLDPADPTCSGYGGERAWRGSGGGASALFPRPAFQAGCGVPRGTGRLVPDVSLAANPRPGNYVALAGRWFVVGGTSAATAMWGGLFTRVAEQVGGPGPGAPARELYALCGGPAFHDVTRGSNGAYRARPGYDQVTGLGSPDVATLLTLY
jgi:subtilase family serine protease